MVSADIGDGGVTTDCRQVPPVLVAKGRGWAVRQPVEHNAGGVAALLHGDRRGAG